MAPCMYVRKPRKIKAIHKLNNTSATGSPGRVPRVVWQGSGTPRMSGEKGVVHHILQDPLHMQRKAGGCFILLGGGHQAMNIGRSRTKGLHGMQEGHILGRQAGEGLPKNHVKGRTKVHKQDSRRLCRMLRPCLMALKDVMGHICAQSCAPAQL